MIRVLVVEDSPTARELLVSILSSDPDIEVVATANTGEEAVEAVQRIRPDIVTMDVPIPGMNGFEATRRIMETYPTPIVIVSAADDKDTTKAFQAIESGALAILQKPFGLNHPEHERHAADLIRTVKMMSEVKVVRRWPRRRRPAETSRVATVSTDYGFRRAQTSIRLVAIGASTGGPPALQTILAGLPKDFPVPILIVQHIVDGFTHYFVEWLTQSSNLPIHLPNHGQQALPGHVYVAPDKLHMAITADGRIHLVEAEVENGLRPSVSYLFRSVAKAYGPGGVGVLLTGMGRDGARELKSMKEGGAVTIVQDRDTSAVYGMPGEAVRLGGASYILSPERIHLLLAYLTADHAGSEQRTMANEQGHDLASS